MALDPSLEVAKTNLRSLLSEAVTAGFKKRKPARTNKATLVPLSTLDSVRFGLWARPPR
jgi:hypothetical protein